jgi:prepilin-type processing-associated H-X9-DG protein
VKRAFALALLALPLFVPTLNAGERPALPADLAAVPTDGYGFVHIRLADVWKSDALKDIRETILKAGEKALEGFDRRFLPHPSTIERLTVVVLPGRNPDAEPQFLFLLAVNKPVDRQAFLVGMMPDAKPMKRIGDSYYVSEKMHMAVSFISNQVLAFGPPDAIGNYHSQKWQSDGPLLDALHLANTKRHITAGGNISALPAKVLANAPASVKPLLKARTVTLGLDIADPVVISGGLHFASTDDATAGEEALKSLANLARDELKKFREELLDKVIGDGKVAPIDELPMAALSLLGLGAIERLDEFLAKPPLTRSGKSLAVEIKLPGGSGFVGMAAVGVGLLLPAVQKVREAAGRVQSQNNLKQIGLALHSYHDANGQFPPAAICDKNGKPLLSWRVTILPYIEQNALYNQFKLDEPWDSEHNIKLSRTLVKVYMSPQAPASSEVGLTHYRVFHGKDAIFDLNKGRVITGITDGTSNTWMVVEAAEGVPWTKPDDFEYDPKKPLPKFASFTSGGFNVLYADGSVRFIRDTVSEKTLRAMITANGGEIIDEKEIP